MDMFLEQAMVNARPSNGRIEEGIIDYTTSCALMLGVVGVLGVRHTVENPF